mmetsp:Transcript_4293/g.5923  ORF Transcript_4293/g.5923 Transcript_4293/m.5923 type:complete len:338 (-) Transcript_4293:226-1239(-)
MMDTFLSHVENYDSPLPTFFEMFMQERILHGLKPAAQHIVTVLCDRWPFLVGLLSNFDEIYALASVLVEGHHLHKHDGLLSEHLYGMRRAKLDHQTGRMLPLKQWDRGVALLLAVLVPYLKAKLDKICRKLQEESNEDPRFNENQNRFARVKRFYLSAYPIFHAAYEGSFFVYQWMYLIGGTPYFSPMLRISDQVVRHLTAADMMAAQSEPGGAVSTMADRVVRWGRVGLVAGLIAFKLLEWWHRGVQSGDLGVARGPTYIPPPPLPIKPSSRGIPLYRDKSLCPICRQPRKTPALAASGYVFCYNCIVEYLRNHGVCPVTLFPCNEQQLRKLYESS